MSHKDARRRPLSKGGAQQNQQTRAIADLYSFCHATLAAGHSLVPPEYLRHGIDEVQTYARSLARALASWAAKSYNGTPAPAAATVEALDLVAQVDAVCESVYALAAHLESEASE